MSKIFVAAGGTGEHALLAYLNLSLLCDFEPVKYYVLDSDKESAEGTVMRAISDFKAANDSYGLKVAGEIIDPKPVYRSGSTKFEELVRTDHNLDPWLLESFFEKESQLGQDISSGFFGQPAIGSVCIHYRLKELAENNASALAQFLNEVAEPGSVVAVVGSNFGGTGAGGAPIIGKWIHDHHLKHNSETKQLFNLLISHYKWYNLGSPRAKSRITNDKLEENAHAGMRFYEDKLTQVFDKIVMLGLPENVDRPHSGDSQQKESKDLLNLLTGALANSYFQMPFKVLKNPANDNRLNLLIDDIPIGVGAIRVRGRGGERENPWKETDFQDSLEAGVTISYFLGSILFWLSEYIQTSYYQDQFFLENHFPKEFDGLLRRVLVKPLAEHLGVLARNLKASLDWLRGFQTSCNAIDFTFSKMPNKYTIDEIRMTEIMQIVQPVFKRAYGISFKELFMEVFKNELADKKKGDEKEIANEITKMLRSYLLENIR